MPEVELFELDGGEEISHLFPDDLMFDQWATLTDSWLAFLCEELYELTLAELRPKNIKPRAVLVDGIRAVVPTIIANLLVLHQEKPDESRLVVQFERRKKTRYDRPNLRKLPDVVNALERLGYIIKHNAVFKEKRTTIEATEKLKSRLLIPDVDQSEIVRADGEETIQLTARPTVTWIGGKKQPKTLVDYKDTRRSKKLREEMEVINRFLNSHSITLEDTPTPPFLLTRRFSLRRLSDRAKFDLHGRIYGGFWMTLKATKRHRLRIDGEPIADLDFSNMFPQLAYCHVGLAPPEGDLYGIPGLEDHRAGAKAGLSALLSYRTEMKSLPTRLKERLPEGWTASDLKSACVSHHPGIATLFEKDFGLDLMFTESNILLATLSNLMAEGIPALPMHDGIMVPRSKATTAKAVMSEASNEVIGKEIPVTIKG